jgi:hypothetical protein
VPYGTSLSPQETRRTPPRTSSGATRNHDKSLAVLRDFDRAQALVASNFEFKGPFVEAASNIRLISSRSQEGMPRVTTADDVRSEDSCQGSTGKDRDGGLNRGLLRASRRVHPEACIDLRAVYVERQVAVTGWKRSWLFRGLCGAQPKPRFSMIVSN